MQCLYTVQPRCLSIARVSLYTCCAQIGRRYLYQKQIMKPPPFSFETVIFSPQEIKNFFPYKRDTLCPRSSDPFYIVSYCIKWVTTSWKHSTYFFLFNHESKCFKQVFITQPYHEKGSPNMSSGLFPMGKKSCMKGEKKFSFSAFKGEVLKIL